MLRDFPLNKVFTLIEPGPVLLLTTVSGRKKNIMTVTWAMPMGFSPTIALVTGSWNYSFEALMKTRECVLALPGIDLMEQTVGIGACSGSDTDKFKKFALTPGKAAEVKAPLIRECLYNIECEVADYLEPHGIFILEGVRAWRNEERKEQRIFHARGDGTFSADGEIFNLRNVMADKLPPGV